MSEARRALNRSGIMPSLTENQIEKICEAMETFATDKLKQHFAIARGADEITFAERKERITDVIKEFYNVDFLSRTRKREYVWPRQVACHCLRLFVGMSYSDIAKAVGYDNHTTVIHSTRTVRKMCDTYPAMKREVIRIETILE